VATDLDKVRRERRRIRDYLKTENALNESDLMAEWTVFTVCHWADAPAVKHHFVSVRRLFGEAYVKRLLAQKTLLDNLVRVQMTRAAAPNRAERGSSGNLLSPTGSSHDVRSRERGNGNALRTPQKPARTLSITTGSTKLAASPRYVLHLFNFWTETYSYRVVSLEDNHRSEVAFLHIPRHSAHIYAASLTTDPTLPKYVGSNLHFTCGSEVHRAYMTAPSMEAEASLRAAALTHLQSVADYNTHPRGGVASQYWNSHDIGGGEDFTFGFGFGEDIGTSGGAESNSSASYMAPTPGRPAESRTFVPVVKSMYISFEHGALREAEWGGFIWVYLPVNGTNPLMAGNSLDKIHVSGSAWDSSAHCATTQRWAGGIGASSALVEECEADTSSGERGAFLPASAAKAVSSDAIADRAKQAHTAQLVCRVTAPECKIYGAVYRISVACACDSPASDAKNNDNHTNRDRDGDNPGGPAAGRGSQHAPLGHVPLQRAYSDPTHGAPVQASGCPGDEYSSSNEGYDRPDLEYVMVSWVYDVKETAASAAQGRV
jgi:hypothetical protein